MNSKQQSKIIIAKLCLEIEKIPDADHRKRIIHLIAEYQKWIEIEISDLKEIVLNKDT